MQYVMQFKLLQFDEHWGNSQPVQLPQGIAYKAIKPAELRVVAELVPGIVNTYVFTLLEGEIVGVSVPENLVFIPKVEKPKELKGVQL